MPLALLNAKKMAHRAIRLPFIVDLPEFAPDFPTTAPLDGLFDALNALSTARVCRGLKNVSR